MSQNALSTYVQSSSPSYVRHTNMTSHVRHTIMTLYMRHTIMTSYVGRTTSLPCRVPLSTSVRAVEWRRRDQSNYVLRSRNGHNELRKQDPSYKKRAFLKNRKMRKGDASLALRNINPGDSGVYKCRVKENKSRRRRRGVLSSPPVSTVNLQVKLEQEMTANRGDDFLLPCWAPRDAAIDAVEWIRTDLDPDTYIFLMRDNIPDPTKQHEDYKNRVELRDPDLKDGNLSLVLRNVSSKDVGTYVCRMKTSGGRQKTATIESKPISIIHLRVENPVLKITVHAGKNATFPCQAAVDADVTALEWTRPDLEHDGYVCLVRDGIADPTRQHPSYRDRVALVDPQLRNGDLSLVLKNATRSDTGTYECRLIRQEGRQKRATIQTEPVSIIQLLVPKSGDEEDDKDKNRTLPTDIVPTEPRVRQRYGMIASVGLAGFAGLIHFIRFLKNH